MGTDSAMQRIELKNALRLLALALMSASSCAGATPPASKPAPNVLLVTIDTVRADHLGCYGDTHIQTPTVDALAREGIVFEHAISQVPLTWPSHAALLTGLEPFQNGVQDFAGQPLDARFRSVAQAFRKNGYSTGAVVSAFVLDRSWGLARGFDFYDDAFSPEAFTARNPGLIERRAGESVSRALSWLKKDPGTPFFFWLHLYDPHSPYDPPEPYRAQYQNHPYDGEIAYADHELGRLIAWLKQAQLYNRTLIVLLSDHGESLGEHGEHEHGFFVYNATIHVPLIVKPPAGTGFRPTRISRVVETTAVAPTLLRLAGIRDEIEKQFQASALLGGPATEADEAYSETLYPFSSFGWSPLHSLEASRYHYIDAPEPELYDLDLDPGESRNLAPERPATIAVFKEKLHQRLTHEPYAVQAANAPHLSEDGQEKLRALGYFGFRAPVSPKALAAGLPDPKEKLEEFNTILQAEDALQANEVQRAEDLLSSVERRDPQMYIIPFLLGEAAIRNQNWQRAAEQLQRCMVLNPYFDSAMTGLAMALTRLGRVDEARQWLNKATESNPENYRAWYQLGVLEGDSVPAASLQAYEKTVAIQPNFSPAQRAFGMALFRKKEYASASSHLEKAIALGPEDAPLHNFLGICYSQMHELIKALAEHRRAVDLDPKLAEAHLNLAYDYQLLHRPKEAHHEYEQACRLAEQFCKFVP